MIIRYANGTTVDLSLLSEGDGVLKLAVKGLDEGGPNTVADPMMFKTLPGACFANSHESVQIEMRTEQVAEEPRRLPKPAPAPALVPEPPAHSSKEMAAWMLRLLLTEEEGTDSNATQSRLDDMGLPRDLQHTVRMPWGNQAPKREKPVARPRAVNRESDLFADLHQKLARAASA
jgi:hypothetical protein